MVTKDGSAMSKSRGNIVDPDDILKQYGADALRVFIIFASPPDKEFAWSEDGLEGCFRFLLRIWSLVHENLDLFEAGAGCETGAGPAGDAASRLTRKMHQTIRKVGEDIQVRFHLNTAVSSIMELLNAIKKEKDALRETREGRAALGRALETLVALLSPFAPHMAEELWEKTGHEGLLMSSAWPAFDPGLAREELVTVVVQVNGKLRDKFEAEPGLPEAGMETRALALPKVQAALAGRPPRKVICVKDKLVNIVG
jgi:leucyl-tRNA synthetase